jgi:hypothetical protein
MGGTPTSWYVQRPKIFRLDINNIFINTKAFSFLPRSSIGELMKDIQGEVPSQLRSGLLFHLPMRSYANNYVQYYYNRAFYYNYFVNIFSKPFYSTLTSSYVNITFSNGTNFSNGTTTSLDQSSTTDDSANNSKNNISGTSALYGLFGLLGILLVVVVVVLAVLYFRHRRKYRESKSQAILMEIPVKIPTGDIERGEKIGQGEFGEGIVFLQFPFFNLKTNICSLCWHLVQQ